MPTTASAKHPAKFSESLLEVLGRLLRQEQRRLGRPIRVLDPFAGVGLVHSLAVPDEIETVGIEIEAEWAGCHPHTRCGDSLAYMLQMGIALEHGLTDPAPDRPYDAIVTSPAYGNRFSDHHNAQDGSTRRSYRHDLGHDLAEGSSAGMPWGVDYWTFHGRAYQLMRGVLRQPDGDEPGGLLLLNVSDFYRQKARVPATLWHRGALYGAGFVECARPRLVDTPRMRYGENGERADSEMIVRARPVR